jgi:hypothetical protein
MMCGFIPHIAITERSPARMRECGSQILAAKDHANGATFITLAPYRLSY